MGLYILSYSDDLHLVGSPAIVALALKALLQPSPPLETALSLDCHLSAIGLSLSHGKSSILMGNDVTSRTIVDNLGPELLSSLGASISQISSTGHVVLGSPIGSNEHVTAFAEHAAIDEARRILRLISSLLLDRDSTGAPNTDVCKVAALPLALGGARLLPFGHTPPAHLSNPPINQSDSALTYHHASFFPSWSSTWSRVRAWVPPLREKTFPCVSSTTHNSPPLPPFKAQVVDLCLATNLASARLQSHPHRACLPSH